jgi:hypothetical protein
MQQLEQGQQANQLNRMKMEEAQAAAVERNALRGLDPTSPEYENQLFKVNPQIGIAYRKERTTAEAQQATQKAQQAQALKTNLDNYRSFLVGVNDQPAYDAWRGAVTKNIPELANMLPAAFSSDAKNLLLQTADDISKRLNAPPPAPEKAPPPPAMVAEYNFAKTPEGGGFKGDYQQFVTARAAAGRAPAAPRPEQPPVAVVDPMTGKPVYVTREQALSGKMTPASAMEGLTPKEIQNREAKYPVAKRATATVSATMTEIENTIDRLLANEKGLNGITGFVGGRTFAVTNEARKAEADLKQLKNLAFVQGLTELRNASSTGAGVGNVSNKEGDRFENLKASLEQTQSTDDLIASLKRLKSQSTATRDTVSQAFEDTYAYRANAPAAAARPSGGGAPPPPPGFKPD